MTANVASSGRHTKRTAAGPLAAARAPESGRSDQKSGVMLIKKVSLCWKLLLITASVLPFTEVEERTLSIHPSFDLSILFGGTVLIPSALFRSHVELRSQLDPYNLTQVTDFLV